MPTPPIKSHVENLLRSREPALVNLMLGGWARWWANPERAILYRRSRATLVHNYMMIDAPAALGADPGIRLVPGQETIYFVVDQALVFRLKMGDSAGLSSNKETQTSLAFVDPQEMLPGLPDVGRVDVVYVLNQLETLIDRILVVARDCDRISWDYPIYPRAVAAADTPILGVQPRPPAPADNVVRLPAAPKKKENNQPEE